MVLEDIRRPIRKRMAEIDPVNLLQLIITDRDGVMVLKVGNDSQQHKLTKIEECLSRTPVSTYIVASDQLQRMNLGANKTMISTYGKVKVAHFDHSQLILTIIGTEKVLLGQMKALSESLEQLIEDIGKIVLKDE